MMSKPAIKREQQTELLHALNTAAASLQRSAHSEDEVFRVFGEQVVGLGLRGGLSLLDESGKRLIVRAVAEPGQIQKALARLEKLVGIQAKSFTILVAEVDAYRRVMESGEAIFVRDTSTIVAQLIPAAARPVLRRILKVFGAAPGVFAPLVTEGKVQGLLNMIGASLTADDVPAIAAFANHIAVALENARLFSTLRESEERYRAVVEQATESIFLTDAETGRVITANSSFEKLLGYSVEELQKLTLYDFIAHERESIDKNINLIIKKKRHSIGERKYRRKDGALVDVEVSGHSTHQKGRQVLCVVLRDISERKQAGEALNLFRTLVDRSNDAIEVLDPETGRFLDVNEKGCLDLGYSREEFLALSVFDIDPMLDQSVFTRVVEELKKSGVLLWESSHRRKDGSTFPVEVNIKYVQLDRDYIVTVVRDITERKRAEESLRTSEEKYRLIIENAGEALYVVQNGLIVFVNPMFEKIAELSASEMIGKSVMEFVPAQEDRMAAMKSHQRLLRGKIANAHREFKVRLRSGAERWIDVNEVRTTWGGELAALTFATDISGRKQAEEALRRSHDLLNLTGQMAQVGGWELNLETQTLYWTEEVYRIHEVDPATRPNVAEAINFYAPESQPVISAAVQAGIDSGTPWDLELQLITAKGRRIWVRAQGSAERRDGKTVRLYGAFQDITERKRAEEVLRESESLLRESQIIAGLGSYVLDISSGIWTSSMVLDQIFGIDETYTYSVEGWVALVHPDWREQMFDYYANEVLGRQSRFDKEYKIVRNKDKMERWVHGLGELEFDDQNRTIKMHGTIQDITERKRAEEVLQRAEENYRNLFENSLNGIFQSTPEGRFVMVNPALARIWGYDSPEDLLASVTDTARQVYVDPDSRAQHTRLLKEQDGSVTGFVYQAHRKDGTTIWVSENVRSVVDEDGALLYYEGAVEDISERKRAEEEIRQRLGELEVLYQSGLALSQLLKPKEIAQKIIDLLDQKLDWHHTTIRRYHPQAETLELLAFNQPGLRSEHEKSAVEERFKTSVAKKGQGLSGWVIEHSQSVRTSDLINDARYVETFPGLQSGLYVPIKIAERVIGVISIESEAADAFSEADERLVATLAGQAASALENARLFEETERRLKNLQSLHAIDKAITGSMDLGRNLDVIIDQVISQLNPDAAVMLLYDQTAQALKYAQGRGFRTEALQHTHLPLGQGYAGRVALGRQIIQIPDLQTRTTDFLRSPTFSQEGFVSYIGVPLIAKGEIKGVLEVFHRAAFEAQTDWLNFLEALAVQTAIAIDNATLFKDLQLSNADLSMAYDATIEGWSHAMDLRDKETEGHTLRVTEMTVRLARAMNISDAEIIHIRRGALLHDIGKMGVPDGILLKPDKLTDEEWILMRQHPQFAFDMLSPIAYLKPALDIPYCHHEKWDGTGYPQGLRGEQIPLAACIFAMADVYDALTSDRPYRKAWSKEKVDEYIRAQAGTHFDPKAVELFFQVISEKA